MFNRVKNAINEFVVRRQDTPQRKSSSEVQSEAQYGRLTSKLIYSRPPFLDLTNEEASANTSKLRKPLTPKCPDCLPFYSGYCEIINAGKSSSNEDCSIALTINLTSSESPTDNHSPLTSSLSVGSNSSAQNKSTKVDSENEQNGQKETPEPELVEHNDSDRNESKRHSNSDIEDINDSPTNKKLPELVPENMYYTDCNESTNLRFDYFAIFDGHAGPGAALYASNIVHQLLAERFRQVLHLIGPNSNAYIPPYLQDPNIPSGEWPSTKLSPESLVTGIIQEVIVETDKHLLVDRKLWALKGGCTVLVVVFIIGKMFVASAGDCRAVLCQTSPKESKEHKNENGMTAIPMSQDFTPLTERRRLQYLAYIQPSLLSIYFTRLEFVKKIFPNDVGKQVLYRDYHMTGWAYKTITEEDVKSPMIQGSGKASRLLGTIGVTRGLGDHSVIALNLIEEVPIKPFLSSIPEVRVHDLGLYDHHQDDVLIMASDGLWDVVSNEYASQIVTNCLSHIDADDPTRYTKAAEKLALVARGELENGFWRMPGGRLSSADDITVFVIPMLKARQIHCQEK